MMSDLAHIDPILCITSAGKKNLGVNVGQVFNCKRLKLEPVIWSNYEDVISFNYWVFLLVHMSKIKS
mgnify:CR=1 FL=1